VQITTLGPFYNKYFDKLKLVCLFFAAMVINNLDSMFETQSIHCRFNEAIYMKKKRLFHQAIRQQQRDSIISRLR
jgi:hypothetical protein